MEPRLQERVLAIFHYALKPGGFLLLGTSESVGRLLRLSSRRWTRSTGSIRGRQTAGPPRSALPGAQRRRPRAGDSGAALTPRAAVPPDVPRGSRPDPAGPYAPAGVVVDDDLDILEFRGDTHPYLEHGARPGQPQPDPDGSQGAAAGAAPGDPGGQKQGRARPQARACASATAASSAT